MYIWEYTQDIIYIECAKKFHDLIPSSPSVIGGLEVVWVSTPLLWIFQTFAQDENE